MTARGEIALTVNGAQRRVPAAWGDETLLDTLREQLGLVGAKYGCGIGLCGACKVQLDGAAGPGLPRADRRRERSQHRDARRPRGSGLHRLQRAWIDERVPQCGYCQAGQLVQAAALLASSPEPSDDEIRAAMDGNLCRCGTYERIRRAIRRAAREARAAETPSRG